jgi:NAD+-dependent protein deacetylase SIR2
MSSVSLGNGVNIRQEDSSSVQISKVSREFPLENQEERKPPSQTTFAVEITGVKGMMDAGRLPCEILDLTIHGIESSELCRRTMKLLANAKRILVIAGAGISVAAGIPDFRSSTGLFASLRADTKYKPSGKALFDASVYQSEAGTQSYNEMIQSLHTLTSDANPTSFHHFLDKISPRLLRLYTQNIDSLENRFPSLSTIVPLPQKSPWPKTIQLHGDLNFASCSKCHWIGSLDPCQLSSNGEAGCQECKVADDVRQVVGKRCLGVGMIRPRVVLYNEPNPDAVCHFWNETKCRMLLELCQMQTFDRDRRRI